MKSQFFAVGFCGLCAFWGTPMPTIGCISTSNALRDSSVSIFAYTMARSIGPGGTRTGGGKRRCQSAASRRVHYASAVIKY